MPTAQDFQIALKELFRNAGGQYIDINSGELHRKVGGYPGHNHRMPVCCEVMYKNMRGKDAVLEAPLSGKGASLTVRYVLPR